MGESGDEEFAPLFDYSHVQPAGIYCISDEDSDSSPHLPSRKRKNDGCLKEKSGAGGKVEAVLDVEENGSKNRSVDEEDWLPPPPKLQAIGSGILDDKALQELRLMKQELALLAQSAEDFVKSVNESSKNDDSSLDDSAAEVKGDKSSKRIEREKIIISIQDKCGQKQYRIHMDDTFEKLFKLYAEKEKLKLECLTFCFDGETISPAITPGILGLENDDMIEVHAKSA